MELCEWGGRGVVVADGTGWTGMGRRGGEREDVRLVGRGLSWGDAPGWYGVAPLAHPNDLFSRRLFSTRRCSEPGKRLAVATVASRAKGRRGRVVRPD
jgi:hypothetical protein